MKTFALTLTFTLFYIACFTVSVSNAETKVKSFGKIVDHEKYIFSESGSMNKKWKMVYEVAVSKSPSEAVEFLNQCMNSKFWYLQSAGFKSFDKLYPQKGLVHARKMVLSSPSLIVRTDAVEYIKKHGNQKDIEILFKAIKSPKNFRGRHSLWIRPALAKAIDHLEDKESSSDQWQKLRHDSDKLVRKIARKQSKF